MSYYDTLGLDESASDDLIKRRYRELAKKYHPDKVKSDDQVEATKRFQEISVAYSVLQDSENRKRVKRLKSNSMFHKFAEHLSDLSPSVIKFLLDIMQTGTITSSAALFFFTKKFSGKLLKSYGWDVTTLYKILEVLFDMSARPKTEKDMDMEIEVSASLDSVYRCEQRIIKIPRIRACACKGTGQIFICKTCNMGYLFDGICVKCSCSSLIAMECKECDGEGEKKEIKNFSISLDKSKTVFIEDGNHRKHTKLPGDLIFIVVPTLPNKSAFKIWNEKHLVMTRPISLHEMVNGFRTNIVLPNGQKKRLHIGGPIQPTCYKRIGWGIHYNGDQNRGDLFVCCVLHCTDEDYDILRNTGNLDENDDNTSSYTLKTCHYAETSAINEEMKVISSNTKKDEIDFSSNT